MPFIRQTRDKRGFEHTYVMHVARPTTGAPRTRVLYLFRTPANLAVGRTALDSEVMEALEHTHPDLSFDWNSMNREAVIVRPDAGPQRQQRPPQRSRPGAPAGRPGSPPPEPVSDTSRLTATLGAQEATRLRRRYHDLLHRIGRRARTPEDRTRLLDEARRLDPERWEEEAAIRSGASSMDTECNRILTELPSRRRGRRGGKRRIEGGAVPPDRSGIMTGGSNQHEQPPNDPNLDAAGGDDATGRDAGDRPADPEADPETDLSIDD